MKPVKKILALILAGVMALALLTGCGKATSLNRTVAEGLAEYTKLTLAQAGNDKNISVSYQVPELGRNIAPLFDENWITKDNSGKDALTEAAKETLTDILNSYMSDSSVVFLATDITDVKNPVLEVLNLTYSDIAFHPTDPSTFDPTSITSMKIEVTHKTVNGRTYALAVIIGK
jgi:hypothetical protein